MKKINLYNKKENKIMALHFSDKKIDDFEIKDRGAIYFMKHPGHDSGFPVKSGSYKELKEEKNIEDDWESGLAHEGWYYGDYVNVVELETDKSKILDLRNKKNREWLIENVEDFKDMNLEEDESEIEELMDNFYDNPQEVNVNKAAREKGYDIVIYEDQSEGNPYDSYAVVNSNIIKENWR